MHVKHLVILCPYPRQKAPSQRFRFEQYLPLLEEKGVKITLLPLFNQLTTSFGFNLQSGIRLLPAFIMRFFDCLKVLKAQVVLIHREILLIGLPVLEWFVTRVLRKKVIYDFDDAIG